MGVPVGAGTDATRVASYNPFVSLYWMTTGKTLGGLGLYPESARLSREESSPPLHPGEHLDVAGRREARGNFPRTTR